MSTPGTSRRDLLALLSGAMLLAPAHAGMRHESRYLFGSPVDLWLPQQAPSAAVTDVLRGLETINARWNAWKPGDVTVMNQAFRAGRSVTTTPALVSLILGAARLEQRSAGFFNAGIGGLVGAWGFHDDQLGPGRRPPAALVEAWSKAAPSLTQLEIRGLDVRSRNPRLQLDFGGYAKGVAIDWALDHLRRCGVHDALLNLGGNLAAMGNRGARPWVVGLRDPDNEGLMASLCTRDREAVVTSGSYERFRVLDGERVTHIFDPRTGEPAPELVSVTVVHPSAALADAAATALLVAGPGRWRHVAQRMGVDQVLVVDRCGRRDATANMEMRLLPGT